MSSIRRRRAAGNLLGCGDPRHRDWENNVYAKSCHWLSSFCLVASVSSGACGQSVQDFYKGKQVRLISGHPVGGDYDVGARFLAKHLQRHIPGQPAVIVQNMPQAASIVAANFIANVAPRDGTVIGSFSRNFASQAMMGQANIEADPRRFIFTTGTRHRY